MLHGTRLYKESRLLAPPNRHGLRSQSQQAQGCVCIRWNSIFCAVYRSGDLPGENWRIGDGFISVAGDRGPNGLPVTIGENRQPRPAEMDFAVNQEFQSKKTIADVFPRAPLT